ncbi:M20/M25/M40 family metallo-hydrolase [Cohnella cholangitidis]|uniref:M20/M25/M40 family metallo-hydrolase n=1 Tax=Cohnella cholangitidis TaxID=2598458 RepID=A0A7G5C512_9BACL|nr:M20/M25/M40 family metallo-hydrolase [Cohnella cholangitidis]QMV44296.1 M20/M25/M40 family metallo-hydrolase [Cohnella cholangitidis]
MVQRDRLIKEFMELVQIDSETKYETEISKVLKSKFEAFGLEVEEDDVAEKIGHGAGNLFAWLPASAGQENVPTILFTSHMDTVSPGKGIKPRLDDDGYIRSDGTTILGADDKAGLAAIFETLRVIKEQGVAHGGIQFVITTGEESGLLGSRAMDGSRLRAKFGYALDSNGAIGDIAVAAPTNSRQYITIKGKAAHAGVNPEDGISAIQVASKAVSRMKLGRIDSETTANIGRFEGGGEVNIVTDSIKIYAEARSQVQEKMDRQIELMREAVESAASESGAEFEFVTTTIYPAYSYGDEDEVVQVAKAAIEAIGLKPRTFSSGGGSDANMFNGNGVPTVNLAVGYEHIHTTKEQIKADDLVKTAELVLSIVKETLSR